MEPVSGPVVQLYPAGAIPLIAAEAIMEGDARARVEDLMVRPVEVVHPEDTLAVARERLAAAGIGALPVVDGDELVGMLASEDIERHAREQRRAPEGVEVRDVVAPGLVHCFAEQDPAEVAAAMAELGVSHLPVLDADKKLVGIVARDDLPAPRGRAKARFSEASGGEAAKEPHPGLKVYSDKPRLKE